MNFDRIAPHYDWLEALTAGSRLQRARTAWIEELRDCRTILSAGEGHGRFAAACAARFPDARLTCIEASARMLARARRRAGAVAHQITWIHGDVMDSSIHAAGPAESPRCDAIVTCFFLDCFAPDALAEVIGRLAAQAAPRAAWLVADFAVPPHGLARLRGRAIHALMYAFFRRAVRLPARRWTPPDRLLEAQGFQLVGRREFEWGLIRSDCWRRDVLSV